MKIGGVTHLSSKYEHRFGIICLHSVFGLSKALSRYNRYTQNLYDSCHCSRKYLSPYLFSSYFSIPISRYGYIYSKARVGWWFLQTKSMSQYRLTLLVDAGGGIWTHGPLRDEVSLPHGSEHRAHGLTPLAMLGNSRVCITFEWTEIYILSIRLDIRKCLVSKGLIVRHTELPV